MKRASRRLIAYYRVSTQKQGASGLGLEGQAAAVAAYALANVLERLPALLNERRRPTEVTAGSGCVFCPKVRIPRES